jgi:hypothetical protein
MGWFLKNAGSWLFQFLESGFQSSENFFINGPHVCFPVRAVRFHVVRQDTVAIDT